MYACTYILKVVLIIATAVAFSQARPSFSTTTTTSQRARMMTTTTTTTSPTTSSPPPAAATTVRNSKTPQSYSVALKIRGGVGETKNNGTTMPLIHGILRTIKIGFYFALYYALSIYYNIVNKRVLNAFPAFLTVGSLQLGCGGLIATLFWKLKLRSPPIVHKDNQTTTNSFRALGLCSAAGHLSAIISLGAGPVSFTHIVKAMEPFFSAIISALILGQWMNPVVYATLIPVVGGVGYACLKERSFSWLAFWMAMVSNVAYAFRAVLSKVAMGGGNNNNNNSIGSNLTPPNVLGLVTLESFWISIPIALIGEGFGIRQQWSDAIQHHDAVLLVQEILLSGLVYYCSNEAMFFCLDSVHPVTFSVGNTMKRVCIVVASVLVFHNDITTQAAVGSAIGIGGAFLYSLTKQHYEKLESKQKESQRSKRAQENTAKKQK